MPAEFDFGNLKTAYENFREPKVQVEVEGMEVTGDDGLGVIEVEVEQTSGFEASIATVAFSGAYDVDKKVFDIKKTKKFLFMGSSIVIYTGYAKSIREVFRGFIAKVHFIVPDPGTNDVPCIEVTAMDVKGLLMANRHSKRLKSQYYSDAVKEVIQSNAFMTRRDAKGKLFMNSVISPTPDKPVQPPAGKQPTTDRRIEMVEESDYEFIVKAAKRFNYEFFALGENLYFIEAKKNKTPLLVLGPATGFKNIDVGYDITGIVRSVTVRNIDMEQGKYIGDKKKSKTKISLGNKAKALVDKQSMVYLDPTTNDKAEAGYRASYLMDSIDYRLGSIEAQFLGIPEVCAGRFVTMKGFGSPVDNDFYLTKVRHILAADTYSIRIEGVANSIKK